LTWLRLTFSLYPSDMISSNALSSSNAFLKISLSSQDLQVSATTRANKWSDSMSCRMLDY
jgi:hypothetical protein